jgi:hypothetical protein
MNWLLENIEGIVFVIMACAVFGEYEAIKTNEGKSQQ